MTASRRVRPAGVVPVELWDVIVGDGIWSERLDEPGVTAAVLRDLHAGRARSRSGASLEACRGFERVHLGGGRACPLEGSPAPVRVSPAGRFIGEAGGLWLTGGAGMVVDVGQTAIKISFAGHRWLIERDLALLPLGGRGRLSLREWVAGAVDRAVGEVGATPCEIVFGLPAALDDLGTPGPCTYVDLDGDVDFAGAVRGLVGLDRANTLVLNDAELAAISARLEIGREVAEGTLVVTLGFGVGGAMLGAVARGP